MGYISPDLFTHSVSYFAEAPLRHHNPEAVRLIAYNCVPKVCAIPPGNPDHGAHPSVLRTVPPPMPPCPMPYTPMPPCPMPCTPMSPCPMPYTPMPPCPVPSQPLHTVPCVVQSLDQKE